MKYALRLLLTLAAFLLWGIEARAVTFGCGNALLFDNTDCGAGAATLYTAIDPAITIANGTQITGCGFAFANNTNYFLAGNIGSSATANCLTFTGLSNVNVDLGGFTVTGAVSLTTASGRNQKIHIYHGGITCNLTGGSSNPCFNTNNNQIAAVAGAFKFHHLTIQNIFDSGTNNITSTGTPFAVGGDLGHNTLTGDTFELYFQYNTVLMTNNNYASGRSGAVQIIGGLAPNLYSNNLITIGGGEAASQGIVAYGHVPGSKIDNNFANLALSLYGPSNVSSRAFMFDASQGTSLVPLEVAFNGGIINDHRCVRIRDSDYPSIHDNYFQTIRFGGASGSNNGTLGCIHLGDPNSFPASAVTSDVCGANATAVDGCTITLSGTQNWVGHEGDSITVGTASPASLLETVIITTGNPSTPNTVKYASNNPVNNNVTSSGAIAFVYSNAMNGLIFNNTFQVDCTVDKSAIVFADRASTGNLFNINIITTIGDCVTGFTGALYKRYLNAAKDNFTIKNTTFLNQLGGTNYPLLTTNNGPSGQNQASGAYLNTLGTNGVTDGDPGWLLQNLGIVSGVGFIKGSGTLKIGP